MSPHQPRWLLEEPKGSCPKQVDVTQIEGNLFGKKGQQPITPSAADNEEGSSTTQDTTKTVRHMYDQTFYHSKRPDFTLKCHFVLYHYSCTHKVWQKYPKITHVGSCDFQKHTERCGNMAKAIRELWLGKFCDACKAGKEITSIGIDDTLTMVEAVHKKIEELEKQGYGTRSSKVVFEDKIEEMVDKLAVLDLTDRLASQPITDSNIKRVAVMSNLEKNGMEESGFVTDLDETAGSKVKGKAPERLTTPTNVSGLRADDEEAIEEEEQFQLGMSRQRLLALPGAENGTGRPERILGRAYNSLSWKSKTKYVEKDMGKGKKVEIEWVGATTWSEDDELWEDKKDWVHVSSDVEEE